LGPGPISDKDAGVSTKQQYRGIEEAEMKLIKPVEGYRRRNRIRN
jgi:hypothetical protein